jgi:hypothetical protein
MFRSGVRCNKDEMHLDPPIVLMLTTAAGWLMIQSGFLKNMLDRRRDRRICPSCGRESSTCACF